MTMSPVEVITRPEPRRRWSLEEKQRIVAAAKLDREIEQLELLLDDLRTTRAKAPARRRLRRPKFQARRASHVRRKFFDVHQATAAPIAKGALERIAALCGVEAEAHGGPPDERRRWRHDRSLPLIEELCAWLVAAVR